MPQALFHWPLFRARGTARTKCCAQRCLGETSRSGQRLRNEHGEYALPRAHVADNVVVWVTKHINATYNMSDIHTLAWESKNTTNRRHNCVVNAPVSTKALQSNVLEPYNAPRTTAHAGTVRASELKPLALRPC